MKRSLVHWGCGLLASIALPLSQASAGLIGYWNFDGNYSDLSSLNKPAQAGPTGQAPLFSTDVPRQFASKPGARSLDMRNRTTPDTANNCYAFVPNSGANYNTGNRFTISCWVKGWPSDQWVPFVAKNGEPNGWQVRRSGGSNEVDFTTRGAGSGFNNGNGDFAGATSPGARATQWFHYCCIFDGTTKFIYINSQLVAQQVNAGATIQASTNNLVFGARDTGAIGGYSRVMLDDVAIWDEALTSFQVTDLFSGTDARLVKDTVVPYNLNVPWGTTGKLGILEARTAGGTIQDLQSSLGAVMNGTQFTSTAIGLLDFKDPESAGGGSGTASTYLSNTAAVADDDFVQTVNACFRVTTAGPYSFAFKGDDGCQAALYGVNWSKINLTNGFASLSGPIMSNLNPTGDTNTIAVVDLVPGDYNFRYIWYERGGGAFNRVLVAAGDKTTIDGDFKVFGDGTAAVTLVDQKPMILGFTSNVPSVLSLPGGGATPTNLTLSWDTRFASSLSISPPLPGSPTLTPGQNSVTFTAPSVQTTYTLTATNGTQSQTANVTILADPTPIVNSFTIADSTLIAGAPVTLSWNTTHALTVNIDNGVGNQASVNSGSVTFPAPATTTTYTLTAANQGGSTPATVTLTVGLPPVIQSFTLGDPNIVPEGNVTLNWNVTNSDSQTISPRPGSVPATGTFKERVTGATNYTLTATNIYASVSQSRSVYIPRLYVTPAGWSVTQVKANPVVGIDNLAKADDLFTGTIPGDTSTQTGYARINFADGAVGVFPGGETHPPGGNGDNFAVKCTATFVARFTGNHTFGINNDDGGRLRIDGNDVIVDNVNHGPLSTTVTIPLTAGQHTIEYLFYEAGGGYAGECYFLHADGTPELLQVGNLFIPTATLTISEFMASNNDTLNDADAQSSDWIEIYNGTSSPISLAGYYLTNDALVKNKWAFPTGSPLTMQPGTYLVVFASSKNTTYPNNEYHTNFNLSAAGGYLALTKDDGAGGFTVVKEYNPYGPQFTDRSYGSYDTEQFDGYFATPTPGGGNFGGYLGFLGDTHFDVNRGVKSAPFTLNITTDVPTATIRYTLDGSAPTAISGLVYSGPLNISTTSVVRAAAFQEDYYPTNIDTHTYVFPANTLTQTQAYALSRGWPLGPVAGQVLDYGMDSRVVTGNEATITAALTQIPTVCLSTDIPNLLDPISGVYVNSNQRGENWERPVSFEILNDSPLANGTTGPVEIQIDGGVRTRGGYSRSDDNPKHAFRLFFSNQYDGPLDYALFGKEGGSSFKNLDLQCPQNYSWSFDPSGAAPGGAFQSNTFMRELFARDTQRDLGQPYTKTRHYHLYINGIYWGIYASQERAENSFGETYLGGDDDNYDVIKSAGGSGGYNTEATDGTMLQGTSGAPGSAWARLWFRTRELRTTPGLTETDRTQRYFEMQGLAPDGVTRLNTVTAPKLLSPENLADYMLTIFYTGGFDSPLSTFLANASNNWYGLRDRLGDNPFVFISHDNEHSMGAEADATNARSTDRTGPWGGSGTNYKGQAQYNTISNYLKSNPQYLHEDLAFAKEYRVKFADRAHRALFNNGALTGTAVTARLDQRAAVLDPVIIAESARWGDSKNANPFTKTDWLNAKSRLYNWVSKGSNEDVIAGTGPGRTAKLVAQLRAYKDTLGAVTTGAADPNLLVMPLYPLFDAPVFSQLGGLISTGSSFTLTNPNTTGDLGTIYYRLDEQDPREIGGAIRPGSLTVASGGAVFPTQSGLIKARIYQTTTQEWSALAEFAFVVGVPASSSNLVISELNYNPIGGLPGTALDEQDYEFVEFWNPSASTIQMDGVVFSTGITFDFTTQSSIATIAPNGRILIVKNLAAFNSRYPGLSAQIAGEFAGSLSSSGEQLIVQNTTTNQEIMNFTYDDDGLLWPKSPDGDGSTLCFTTVNPTTASKSDPANWFAHGIQLGNPGGPDNFNFATFSASESVPANNDDTDGDGLDNLLEYALGSEPDNAGSSLPPAPGIANIVVGVNPAADFQTLTFTKRLGAADIRYEVQVSTALAGWTNDAVLVSRAQNTNGTETLVFRSPNPFGSLNREFMRLHVVTQP